VRSRAEHAVFALAWVLCPPASYGQQPPQPACFHQWVTTGEPYLGPNSNTACGQPATQPHTIFQVDVAGSYIGYVYPYEGQDTKCSTSMVSMMASGECGGTNSEGQPVTCLPQNPAFNSSTARLDRQQPRRHQPARRIAFAVKPGRTKNCCISSGGGRILISHTAVLTAARRR
jgi:hypothetical protein